MTKNSSFLAILYFVIFCSFIVVTILFCKNFFTNKNQKNREAKNEQIKTPVIQPLIDTSNNAIIISSTDIENLISQNLSAEIIEPKADIDFDGIYLTGRIVRLGKIKASIQTKPSIEDGKIIIDITKFKLGLVSAPEFLRKIFKEKIEEVLNKKYSSTNSVESIILEKDKAIIILKGI